MYPTKACYPKGRRIQESDLLLLQLIARRCIESDGKTRFSVFRRPQPVLGL
ncbi:hypothetical protein NEISICOT_00452 [Neisseria sicca ATCC 29256]|uniref:Uncharacterized protein n=1 Tax=Neisseria sicca ATCC 29256 TaxID=547045 RepID=C6M1R6_NEISI|nr:hypothetical protein NEISICOT_00452 [Neisseria sicca ATCC 29256]